MAHLRLVHIASEGDEPDPDEPCDEDDLVAEDDDGEYALTPRQARIVETHATVMADETYEDIEEFGDDPVTGESDTQVLGLLPEVTWTQNKAWRRQLARAFDDLAADVTAGRSPLPTCTGEEMALHLILERSRALHLDGEADHLIVDLPEDPDDTDWESAFEDLFQDHDVLTLFDGPVSGLENEFLDPAKWFNPFDFITARDPERGYRL